MAFKNISSGNILCKFNSETSSDFLKDYENTIIDNELKNWKREHSNYIVASSFRCERVQYFRLRGVEPDNINTFSITDSFIKSMGDSIHYNVQKNLRSLSSFKFVSVEDYLKKFPIHYKYELEISDNYMETKIRILDENLPVQMSCDGILEYKNRYYILEIKSSEYSSWGNLTNPKPEHIDQIKMYSAILGIKDALAFYVERQYGGLKCFELNFKQNEIDSVYDRINKIVDCVNKNICPEPLNKNDSWCKPNRCIYFNTCKIFGR